MKVPLIRMAVYGKWVFVPQKAFPLDETSPYRVFPLLGSYCTCFPTVPTNLDVIIIIKSRHQYSLQLKWDTIFVSLSSLAHIIIKQWCPTPEIEEQGFLKSQTMTVGQCTQILEATVLCWSLPCKVISWSLPQRCYELTRRFFCYASQCNADQGFVLQVDQMHGKMRQLQFCKQHPLVMAGIAIVLMIKLR